MRSIAGRPKAFAAALLAAALISWLGCASTSPAPASTSEPPTLTTGPAFDGPPLEELLGHELSYQVKDGSAEAMTEALGDLIGGRLVFVARTPDQPVSLEVKAMKVGELLGMLAKRGAAGLASGGKLQLQAWEVSPAQLSRLLTELLGTPVRFAPKDDAPINLQLKALTVEEALRALSRYGAVEVAPSGSTS